MPICFLLHDRRVSPSFSYTWVCIGRGFLDGFGGRCISLRKGPPHPHQSVHSIAVLLARHQERCQPPPPQTSCRRPEENAKGISAEALCAGFMAPGRLLREKRHFPGSNSGRIPRMSNRSSRSLKSYLIDFGCVFSFFQGVELRGLPI